MMEITQTGASTNPKNFDLNKNLNMNLIQIETRITIFVLDRLLYLASLKLSRVAGGGWVVGNSDFDENLVIGPDLDLLCQFFLFQI